MKWFGHRWASMSIAVLMLVLAFATGSLIHGPRHRLRSLIGTGLDSFREQHNFFSPITSVLFSNNFIELLAAVAALIVLVGSAERLMGWWRTVIAFAVTSFVGASVGMVLQAAGLFAREIWAVRIAETVVIDPFTAISGTVMTASAFAGPLWRRRIRVLGFTALVVVFLYSGQPSDLFRLLAAVSGLLLGLILKRVRPGLRWARSSHHEARSLLAAGLMITAVGPFVSIFTPARFGPLHPLGLLFRDALPRMSSVSHHCIAHAREANCAFDIAVARLNGPGLVLLAPLPLLVLIVAALGMLRGRRSAALVAIAVNALLALLAAFYYGFLPALGSDEVVTDNATGLEPIARLAISVSIPLVVAVLIAANLRHFTVRVPRARAFRFIVTIASTFVALSIIYVGVGMVDRTGFRPSVTLRQLLMDLPDRFVPVGFLRLETLVFVPDTPLTRFVYQWIGPTFWIVVLVSCILTFFTERVRDSFTERDRMRALLRQGGRSLGHMATWNGNSYWFTASGRVGIAYRVHSGVAITVSDPVGPETEWEAAVREFVIFCDDNGWMPVFYSVHDDFLAVSAALSFATMVVGEETVIEPSSWSMEGKSWQDVRSSLNRAARLGVRAVWTSYPHLSLATVSQIEAISESWVADKNLPELGFTLGGLDELRDPEVSLLLAIGPDERVEAVTSWMPTWRNGVIVGWTLDFMRRRPDSMNGVMEFLIASAALQMQQTGTQFMSLSAAPLARMPGRASDDDPGFLAFLARTLEPAYGFQALLAFKQKFKPEFRSLHMAYPDALGLPAIGTALARAYLPSLSVRESLRFVRTIL